MKFAIFFFLIFSYLSYTIYVSEIPYTYILVWPALNMLVMTLAYVLNRPSFVLGKKREGRINLFLLIINLPWLLLTWLVFKIQILISKENFADKIEGTNLWLSRRPTSNDNLSKFDVVVDLTCEFPRDKESRKYYCYPNLDGHVLANGPSRQEVIEGDKILIHCANGHGRSALFASLLLNQTKTVQNLNEALELVLQNRKLARPNSSQQKWLLNRTTA